MRSRYNLTRKQLGEYLAVSADQVRNWERKDYSNTPKISLALWLVENMLEENKGNKIAKLHFDGKGVRRLRERKGWTAARLANIFHVGERQVFRWQEPTGKFSRRVELAMIALDLVAEKRQ